jgi:hypothetical protein
VRSGALAATIRREDGGRTFFDLYDRVVSGNRCSVEMREELIEHLDTMRVTHPEHRDRVRRILTGLARDDPSKVVRAMALDYSRF